MLMSLAAPDVEWTCVHREDLDQRQHFKINTTNIQWATADSSVPLVLYKLLWPFMKFCDCEQHLSYHPMHIYGNKITVMSNIGQA